MLFPGLSITRIRFNGYNLSLLQRKKHPYATAKVVLFAQFAIAYAIIFSVLIA